MVWRWGEGKTYYGVPTQALLGEMSTGMTYHPKEARIS